MGLCRPHYEEHAREEAQRDEAVQALHRSVIDGLPIQQPELREEFLKLQKWWTRACTVRNFGGEDPILKDEAEYALEWCISLAKVIITEEKKFRSGDTRKPEWNYTRDWVWDRFKNLEAGLMSNGVERRKEKGA